MFKPLLALAAALSLGIAVAAQPSAAADTSSFQVLQVGDAPQGECGTYVHSKGAQPSTASTVMFMSTERTLFLRTADGVRKLEFAGLSQKLRVADVLGRGDTLNLKFKAQGRERASLAATVTEAVVDEDGGYPLISFEVKATYTSPAGVQFEPSSLEAHDTCL